MWVPEILCLSILLTVGNTAKILGVFMTPSYSHQEVFQPIWKELSLRGHQVTVYTPSPLNDKSLINLTEYDLGFSVEAVKGVAKGGNDVQKLIKTYELTAEMQLNHPYLKDLIKNVKNETYDLLLVEYLWQTYYAFKEVYKVPMIGLASLPLTLTGYDSLGIDRHSVLDPDMFLEFSYASTFKQRVTSWAYNWLYRLNRKLKMAPVFRAQIKKYFGDIKKDSLEIAKEVSLVIGNYNFAIQNVKPLTPNFIPISGIHVKPPKPLPNELGKFLDGLPNNAVYFSLGTNVRYSVVSQASRNRLINVLGQMPYTILWKCDPDELPENLPKNFYVRKWFPQQDVLAHPKVKIFITQGGLQSIDEALSRKVPMLIIPLHCDQIANADRCVRHGIAESLDFNSFTEDEMKEKLNKLVTDRTYRRNIEKLSNIVDDQPMSALDTAVYWIEYVLRHDGAHHLRSKAVDMPFYQYYHLDVYLFVAVLLGVVYRVLNGLVAVVILTCRVIKRLLLARFLTTNDTSPQKKEL